MGLQLRLGSSYAIDIHWLCKPCTQEGEVLAVYAGCNGHRRLDFSWALKIFKIFKLSHQLCLLDMFGNNGTSDWKWLQLRFLQDLCKGSTVLVINFGDTCKTCCKLRQGLPNLLQAVQFVHTCNDTAISYPTSACTWSGTCSSENVAFPIYVPSESSSLFLPNGSKLNLTWNALCTHAQTRMGHGQVWQTHNDAKLLCHITLSEKLAVPVRMAGSWRNLVKRFGSGCTVHQNMILEMRKNTKNTIVILLHFHSLTVRIGTEETDASSVMLCLKVWTSKTVPEESSQPVRSSDEVNGC